MKLISFMQTLFKVYSKSIQIGFILFLFWVLSLGRAFSLLHLNTPLIPLFITEIILLISLPFALLNYKYIPKLPNLFLYSLLAYFSFAYIHLYIGILCDNPFALRDIVLCVYILFFPLTVIIFSERNKLKIFLFILILSNISMVMINRFYNFDFVSLPAQLVRFLNQIRDFNIGLYYGIIISFLISFLSIIKKRIYKIFVLVFLTLNFYMIIFLGLRVVWVSCISLFVFFLLISKRGFVKTIFSLVLGFIIIFSIFYYLDFKFSKASYQEVLLKKIKGIEIFIEHLVSHESSKNLTRESSILPRQQPTYVLPSIKYKHRDNIIFRLDIWWQAISFGLKSPIFGRGFGVYPKYKVWGGVKPSPKHIGPESGVIPTHNHLVSIFYKMGLLGLFLFLFINVYVFRYGILYIKKCNLDFTKHFLMGVLGAFVFWHTMALFFDVIDSPPTSIFLWVIIGLIFCVIEVDKKESKTSHNEN